MVEWSVTDPRSILTSHSLQLLNPFYQQIHRKQASARTVQRVARQKRYGKAVNVHEQSRKETGPVTKRILLADDDLGVRELLGRVLESEHYRVTFAKTGREAAAKFASDPPDLVLLDLNMPDKDGWESFGMMYEEHPFIPVIVITARPNQHEHAVNIGVDALMEKPLDLAILLKAIRTLLAETELERIVRLASPGFKTAFLTYSTHSPANGAPE
jgi:CheY-like chemotaxis protein